MVHLGLSVFAERLSPKKRPDHRAQVRTPASTSSTIEVLEARIALAVVSANWIGGSGSWSDAGNWDIGKVPNNGADTYLVTINVPAAAIITVPGAITITSLTNAESLLLSDSFTIGASIQNSGTITAGQSSSLNLLGSITTASLGAISAQDTGAVNVRGVLDNTSTTLALNATTGSWTLTGGGTIKGGTITGSGGATLLFPQFNSGTLEGVALATDATVNPGYSLTIRNGLTLNSKLTVAGSNATTSLLFPGIQTLNGTGEVLFSGANSFARILVQGGTAQVPSLLTIGSGVTIHGSSGSIGGATAFDDILHQGTIQADVIGSTISVDMGVLTNQGTLAATAGTLVLTGNFAATNPGTITASATGTLNLDGNFTFASLGAFSGVGCGFESRPTHFLVHPGSGLTAGVFRRARALRFELRP